MAAWTADAPTCVGSAPLSEPDQASSSKMPASRATVPLPLPIQSASKPSAWPRSRCNVARKLSNAFVASASSGRISGLTGVRATRRTRSGRLYFECDYYPNNAPTFDEVVRVFGDKWKDHGPLPPARARSWPPAAAPHGNEALTYVFDDALRLGRQVHGKLEVDFAPDAR